MPRRCRVIPLRKKGGGLPRPATGLAEALVWLSARSQSRLVDSSSRILASKTAERIRDPLLAPNTNQRVTTNDEREDQTDLSDSHVTDAHVRIIAFEFCLSKFAYIAAKQGYVAWGGGAYVSRVLLYPRPPAFFVLLRHRRYRLQGNRFSISAIASPPPHLSAPLGTVFSRFFNDYRGGSFEFA